MTVTGINETYVAENDEYLYFKEETRHEKETDCYYPCACNDTWLDCMRKYFWLRPTTTFTKIAERGMTRSAIKVMNTFMLSIITNTPIMVVIEVISVVIP